MLHQVYGKHGKLSNHSGQRKAKFMEETIAMGHSQSWVNMEGCSRRIGTRRRELVCREISRLDYKPHRVLEEDLIDGPGSSPDMITAGDPLSH